MALNYANRIQNLKARRFDPELNKSIVSGGFARADLPDDLRYLAESMMPIEVSYNMKTLEAAENVRKHLENALDLTFDRQYRTQGSVITGTNIKVYSDIDLLSIIDSYAYVPEDQTPDSPYKGSPTDDILALRSQAVKILKSKYDEVDDTGSKSISIVNKNLRRKVDIVPAFWYNSQSYQTSSKEFYRGIYMFDKDERKKIRDFPFAHIQNVQEKGNSTNDGSRMGVRLLKNLKADSDGKITLSSFELTSIVHAIPDGSLYFPSVSRFQLARNISEHLAKMIDDSVFRTGITSPNGTEKPFSSVAIVAALKTVKSDLDELIQDCSKELQSQTFQRSIQNYNL